MLCKLPLKSMTILGLLLLSPWASALADIERETAEKAVFAYFALTDSTPDFEKWIKETGDYKATAFANRKLVLEKETERLKTNFENYALKPTVIKINSNARVFVTDDTQNNKSIPTPALEVNVKDEDGKAKQKILNVRIDEINGAAMPYFDIPYGNESIALIVEEVKDFTNVKLSDEKYEVIKEYFFDETLYNSTIELKLRPLSADGKKPLRLDLEERWLMLADVASLKLTYYDRYSEKDITILSYEAPWFETNLDKNTKKTSE